VAQAAAAAGAAGHRPAWVASLDELAADGHHGSTSITAADGKRRIRSVTLSDGRRLPCNLLVLGYAQPTYELQMQAGLHATLEGEPPAIVPGGDAAFPLLAVGEAAGADGPRSAAAQAEEATAAWLAMAPQPPARGRSLAPTRFPVAPDAFVCLCEDVRVRDVQQAIADGFSDVDLVKRRTGAGTGPCQGKLCHAEIARCLRDNARVAALPTVRPLLRPTTLARLAGGGDG
jgi:sarcosine oxidase subunit beta